MQRRYLAFDIETAKIVSDSESNWNRARPLGITCAAFLPCDATEPIIRHGKNTDGSPAKQMSQSEARDVVIELQRFVAEGYTLLTWNGLGFDLDVLAEESKCLSECKELATEHVDMMFHIFCDRGFPVALDKAAQGLGIRGKLDGMSGRFAPKFWAEGRFQEVLDYVAQDVRIALKIAEQCEKARRFRWMTSKGAISSMELRRGWLTVQEAMNLPEPDTSWMRAPIRRKRFTGWLAKK